MSPPNQDGACRLTLNVRGRVQGVGFRHFVRMRARELELAGWVRNERDGSVSLLAEGPRESLEKLRDRVAQGPPAARVEHIEQSWEKAHGDVTGFRVAG